MTKARQPFMPLFFGDFLSSTGLWTGEQQALYLLLLAHQWSAGPLPADPHELALVVRYDPERFATLWTKVGPKFEVTSAGLVNLRLEEHRLRSAEISSERAAAGKRGAEAKHGKQGGKPVANGVANGKQTGAVVSQSAGNASDKSVANRKHPSHPIPSYSDPSESPSQDLSPSQDPNSTTPDTCSSESTHTPWEAWEAVKDTYPVFTGRQNWIAAEKACQLLVERGDATWDELLAGTQRYAAFVTEGGVSGPDFVTTPVKFFGDADRPWAQPWKPPPKRLTAADEIAAACAEMKNPGRVIEHEPDATRTRTVARR